MQDYRWSSRPAPGGSRPSTPFQQPDGYQTDSGHSSRPVPSATTFNNPPVPRGTCPVCQNSSIDKWRYGRVSEVMVCDRCAKYEERTGQQRPQKLEVRRHQRWLSDANGIGWSGPSPQSIAAARSPTPAPDYGYAQPPPPDGPRFVNWTEQTMQGYPNRSHTPGPEFGSSVQSRSKRAPPGTWVVGTPDMQGVVNLPSPNIRSPSAPPAPSQENCPSCHGPMVNKWRFGSVSQRMVCHSCATYESRNGKVRSIDLEVKKTLRHYGGGLR